MLLAAVFAVLAVSQAWSGRLPDDTEPIAYALTVEPDVSNASFAGRVDIAIRVKTSTPVITLNSKDLTVYEVNVTDDNTDRDIPVRFWRHTEHNEQLTITVDGHVFANRIYKVRLRFAGFLRDDGLGFFKTSYASRTESKRWLAATQFQTTHARNAFPCYDEPRFRTPFDISIKRKRNEIALSNMPILKTIDENVKMANNPVDNQNWTWVYFETSPPISTCLVAFFVGDYERLDNDQQNSINVYSHLGSLYQVEYITKETSDLLKVMEDYTNVSFPMKKLDILTVPELGLGAMENWGLNFYREKLLFVDKNTNTKTIVSAKTLTEHVMAHQWFGDLVSPVWWDFAWLNEGFATYFEYFATAKLEPEWRLEHFFVVEKQQSALEYDQTPKHPLSASVTVPEEIDDVFDQISYNKGAVILKMLKSWVGEKVFRIALNTYVTRHKYSVVKPENLWNAFDHALLSSTKSNLNGKNVHIIMKSWTEMAGYPVVNVTRDNERLILTQERFLTGSSDRNDTTKWYVFLSYTTDKMKNFDIENTSTVWLDPSTNLTTVTVDADVQWYIFNIQSSGFYRVNYSEDNWMSLIKQLNDSPGEVHVLNRAQLIDDSFNLARAGKLNYTIPLALTQYLEKENDLVPWYSAMNGLNYILYSMRRSKSGYGNVKAFVSKLAGIAFQKVDALMKTDKNPQYPVKIGWDVFSSWACKLENENCTKMALHYFRRWRNGEEIPADIKDATFCTGIRLGAQNEDWDKMLNLYKSTTTYSEKESALKALTCSIDVGLLTKQLGLILEDKSPIKRQDYKAFYNYLSSTPSGKNILISFLRRDFQNVTNSRNMVTDICSILATKVSTEYEIKTIQSRLGFVPYDPAENIKKTYQREIKYSEEWYDTNSDTILEFITPGSGWKNKTTPLLTTTTTSPIDISSDSSQLYNNYGILLQTLVLTVSVKLFI